jgi:alkylhydroperoxidase family enzyme
VVADRCAKSPFYSERERAALAWTEALTLLNGAMCPQVFEAARS